MSGIIVGIDGSSHSQGALEWAMREAAIRHQPLTVLTVQPTVKGTYGGSLLFPGDDELRDKLGEAAQEVTDKVAQQLGEAAPSSITVRAVLGVPAAMLVNASQQADLLVVGSRGAGGFARLLMGSVSSQVAHHAHCPIVIIPDDRHQ